MYILVNEKTNAPINVGDTVTTFRGETATVESIHPPRHANSNGNICTDLGLHYASVYGAKFIKPAIKAFKTYKAAKAAAYGGPIVRVGKLHIVGIDSLTSIDVIADGRIDGTVTVSHLLRLGNANHATAKNKKS